MMALDWFCEKPIGAEGRILKKLGYLGKTGRILETNASDKPSILKFFIFCILCILTNINSLQTTTVWLLVFWNKADRV